MKDEDIQFKKLQILMNAIDSLHEEEEPDFIGELKQAGWDILHENPGSDCGDWIAMLVAQFPSEVVDALGANPSEAYARLSDMWESADFTDEQTGECHSFATWAEYFATERSVELYDMLAESRREINAIRALKSKRQ